MGQRRRGLHIRASPGSRAVSGAPGKITFLTPGAKASSENPNFSDFRDPGVAEHGSCWSPSCP